MKKAILFCLLVTFSLMNIYSQKECNNWYFMNYKGITFNTPSGIPIIDTNSAMTTFGSAVISDFLGNLLFYSNGDKIWNKKHKLMKNTTLTTGKAMCQQPAIIIPFIGNGHKYYLFSVGWYSGYKGLSYSVVDMDGDNGLGEVVQKNISLFSPTSENITAIRHSNKTDIWIISHEWDSDNFLSFLVTKDGVSATPVKSKAGSFYTGKHDSLNNYLFKGFIKISPITKKVVSTVPQMKFELFDFDNSTGILTNPILIPCSMITQGAEFSPDGNKLYISMEEFVKEELHQFDLSSYNTFDIINSDYIIAYRNNPNFVGFEVLQLGPDGKIYNNGYLSNRFLHVIHNPNETGSKIKFTINGVYSGDIELGYYGLPNFFPEYLINDNLKLKTNSPLCEGDTIFFNTNELTSNSYLWSGPNGFTSNEKNPVIPNAKTTMSGFYYLRTDSSNYKTYVFVDSFPKVKIIPSGNIKICRGESIILSSIVDSNANYWWASGENTPEIAVKNAGTYTLYASNSSGCMDSASVTVSVNQKPVPKLINLGESIFCSGGATVLTTTEKYVSYKWSTGETTDSLSVKKSGNYYVTIIDSNGCSANSDTIKIVVYPKPNPVIFGPYTVCPGTESVYFVRKFPNSEVKWEIKNGSIISGNDNDTIKVKWGLSGPSKLKVIQTDTITGCTGGDSINIIISNRLKLKISSSSPVLCPGGSVTISAPVGYSEYKWNTDDTTREITVKDTGSFYVNVKETGGCQGVSDTIYVKEATPPTPTINGDTLLCPGRSDILSVLQSYATYNWSTGETTKSISISQPGKYSVTITDTNGCTGSASFEVKQWTLNISQLNDLIFNKINIGNEDTQTFLLTNNSDGDINLASISIKGIEGSTFEVSTNPPVPTLLQKGQSINVIVKFKPQTTKKYLDSLVISIDKPCPETRALACFGEAFNQSYSSTVWLPDTTAEIGYPDFRIPLRAKMDAIDNPTNLTYKAEIRYNGAYFQPNYVTAGALTGNSIENGERILNIEGTATNLNQNETILTEISGLVLLANEERIPLKITNFTWGDTNIAVNKINGSLQVTGTCVQELSMLKLMDKTSIEVVPNPVTDEINIHISKDYSSQVNLKLYNSLGLLIESSNENEVSAGTKTLVYKPKAELSSGTYWLRVETFPSGSLGTRESFVKPFLIIKN